MSGPIEVRASYHGDSGAASGQDQNLPAAIERLPFDLWRSHEYPRRPGLVKHAAREYLDDAPQPDMLLPQRMGFTRWKTPPWRQAYGSNIAAFLAAVIQPEAFRRRIAAVAQAGAPSQPERAAALERMRLPQPSDNMSPEINASEVLPRNVLPQYEIAMTTSDLTQVAEDHTKRAMANDAQKLIARSRAMAEIEQLTSAADGLYQSRGGEEVLPWFLQQG